ncbi:rRNA pseudouridine synthase [Sphingobacteriales bacterium UPWRP_1]|nr:rRNA pseudouridine synthase [Sphingobacteriales bacterium UPWRP_1]
MFGKTGSRNRILRKRKHHAQETQNVQWEDHREHGTPEEELQHPKPQADKENITPAKRKQLERLQEEAMVYEELETKGMRLNKYVAAAGVCSRRHADELIAAGEITVNGEVITAMGHKVFAKDVVKYNNKLLSPSPKVYVLLNKPKNIITTAHDPEGRPTVIDLVKNATNERLYPVGRLDRNTTGLLLLTNDGELAQQLAHPSSEIPKIYYVILNKPLAKEDLDHIAAGVMLEDGLAQVDEIAYVSPIDRSELGVNLHSGKNRVVRRIFERLGYEVEKLDRVMYANLNKKDLPRGRWRYLSPREVRELRQFIANR